MENQAIILIPREEPRILDIDDQLHEITETKLEISNMFGEWKKSGYSADIFTEVEQKIEKINTFNNIYQNYNCSLAMFMNFQSIMNRLSNDFLEFDYSNSQKKIGSAKNLGIQIVDKELIIEKGSLFFSKITEDLASYVDQSKNYYRLLCNVSKKIQISKYGVIIIVLPRVYENPYLSMQYDVEGKSLNWQLTHNSRLIINGKQLSTHELSQYEQLFIQKIQITFFNRLREIMFIDPFDYRVSVGSKTLLINSDHEKDHNLEISKDLHAESRSPLWLPPLCRIALLNGEKLKIAMDQAFFARKSSNILKNAIFKQFLSSDLVRLTHTRNKLNSIITIESKYTSDIITAVSEPQRIILSLVGFSSVPVILEERNFDKLDTWIVKTFWLLFSKAITSFAASYGFSFVHDKLSLTIQCQPHQVKIWHEGNFIKFKILGSFPFLSNWDSIPGLDTESKVNFLFFYKDFCQ